MKTGNRNPGYTGKYTRKRRFSSKTLVLLVSALVLSFAMVGGTLALLSAEAPSKVNSFTVPTPGVRIDEEFDGFVKKNISVTNNGQIPVYVRLQMVINFQNKEGKVAPVAPVQGTNINIQWVDNDDYIDWEKASDGYFYYPVALEPGETTSILISSIEALPDPEIPEGYTLNVQLLAQYVQKDGVADDTGRPLVESCWNVTVDSNGVLIPSAGSMN